jgi:hypothetical protein
VVERRRSYFGFDLDTEVEPLRGLVPGALRSAARDVLAGALVAGETTHPDQGRVKRALAVLDEWWRRSGGTLAPATPETLRASVRMQLESVNGWEEFLGTRIVLDPAALVDETTRARLDALPAMVRLRGDAVPLDYELADGQGIARVRLREGQARRLRDGDLPPLDRPLRFACSAVGTSRSWPTPSPIFRRSSAGRRARPVGAMTTAGHAGRGAPTVRGVAGERCSIVHPGRRCTS